MPVAQIQLEEGGFYLCETGDRTELSTLDELRVVERVRALAPAAMSLTLLTVVAQAR